MAGVELGTAYISLLPSTSKFVPEFNKTISSASGAADSGGKGLGGVMFGALAGVGMSLMNKAIGTISNSMGAAISRADTLSSFPKVMKNLGYSTADAAKSLDIMSDKLQGLPTSLDAMAGAVQVMAPLTASLEEATNISLALNNALIAGGKSTQEQSNALDQYVQMLAVGKVDLQAWRSMVSAMPGQMDQLSKSLLGADAKQTDLYEAMKDGTVTFDDFNQELLKLNDTGLEGFASFQTQALDATDGIGTSLANLGTAITRNLTDVIVKLKPQIDAVVTGLTTFANAAGPVVVAVVQGIGDAFVWAGENWGWIGPLVVAIGTVVAAVVAWKVAVAAGTAVMTAARAVQATWTAIQTGWTAATYSGVAASYASSTAAKVAMVAHKLWNGVVLIGKGLWALMNGTLIKSAALWVANTAKLVAHKVAVIANNAGLALYLKFAAAQIAAGVRSVASWVANTAALVAHRAAVVAGIVVAKAAAAAQWLWNAALTANPIGIVVAAIAALVAGLVWFFTQTELGQEIWANFTQFLTEAWTNITTFLSEAWTNIVTFFTTGQQVVNDLWNGLWTGISTFFTGIWDGIVQFVTTYIMVVSTIINAVVTGISNTWNTVWGAISSFFTGIWQGIVGFVTAYINTVATVIRAVVTGISGAWNAIWSGISSFFSSLWAGIVSAASGYFNAVKRTFDNVMSFIGGIPGKIRGFFTGIGSWLVNSGRSLIQGFIDGITGAFEKAKNFVSDGLAGIRNLFPFSPAKEGPFSGRGWVAYAGQSVGETFTDSIVAGLRSGKSDVSRALAGVQGEFSGVTTSGGGFSVRSAVPALSGARSALQSAPVVIEGNVYGNPDHVADAIDSKRRRAQSTYGVGSIR